MITTTQIIIGIVCELIALVCSIYLATHKDSDGVMRSCGLFGIIGISIALVIEIGVLISQAAN